MGKLEKGIRRLIITRCHGRCDSFRAVDASFKVAAKIQFQIYGGLKVVGGIDFSKRILNDTLTVRMRIFPSSMSQTRSEVLSYIFSRLLGRRLFLR